ncbi:MAG: phage late control D family protein [Spirochaetales bacterium]|nr:phage late control D family protein [Spirochaetales bacterium]
MAQDSEMKSLTPCFIVYLEGSRFTAEQEYAVKQIIVDERVDRPSLFSITMSDTLRQWTDSSDFSEGAEVKIMLGYKDDIEEVFSGEVVAINPQFRMKSDDILVIKGSNAIHRLLRGKKTRSFSEMTDADIIKEIVSECGLKDDIDDIGVNHLFTMQHNQTNYDYLMSMARKYNCNMHVKDKTLMFKQPSDESNEEVIIEWGKTLLEFNVQADTSDLVSEVEVKGWDNEKGEAITGSATVDDIQKLFDRDVFGGSIVKENFGDSKMIILDNSILDQESADALALDIISKNSMNYIHGSGKVQGNYKIHAGMMIELKELGGRFSGKYYVESVKHIFDATAGYTTHFTVLKNAT